MTWIDHFTSGSPSWDVDPTWLSRVSDVVDAALQRNLYALVNVHHDASDWANLGASGANYSMIEEKFYRLWYQIGQQLGCKSERLAFEPINEPPASTQDQYDELNKLQQIFVQALADSGGYNSQRVVTLVGPNENADQTDQFLKIPANMSNPYAIQYHYYSPYDFIFGAWGKTVWGSDTDKQALDTDLSIVRGNFTDVPIIIGEWSASTTYTEAAARQRYYDAFIRTAQKYTTSTMMWDNGGDQLDRPAHIWRDPVALQILMDAVAGTSNSLPDSTEDLNAATQESSAYLFHKAGEDVADVSLPYLFNGNTLKGITGPRGPLTQGTDYTVEESNVTYHAAYLSSLFSRTTAPGTIGNLSLAFSAGATLGTTIVQYDTPELGSTSSAASATPSGSDLTIPITWKGVAELAAVKAVLFDNTCVVDTWTQYLGPLQQCRSTYSSQYNWGPSSVTITSAAVQAVLAAGQSAYFTFEFYPRVPGNAVNYTLAV